MSTFPPQSAINNITGPPTRVRDFAYQPPSTSAHSFVTSERYAQRSMDGYMNATNAGTTPYSGTENLPRFNMNPGGVEVGNTGGHTFGNGYSDIGGATDTGASIPGPMPIPNYLPRTGFTPTNYNKPLSSTAVPIIPIQAQLPREMQAPQSGMNTITFPKPYSERDIGRQRERGRSTHHHKHSDEEWVEQMRSEFEKQMNLREMDTEDVDYGPGNTMAVPAAKMDANTRRNKSRRRPKSQSRERYYSPPPPHLSPEATTHSEPNARADRRTKTYSQPSRAMHISESPYGLNDGARDAVGIPKDYIPVSSRRGRDRRTRSRPEGYGGTAEGQPGPINPNLPPSDAEQRYSTQNQASGPRYSNTSANPARHGHTTTSSYRPYSSPGRYDQGKKHGAAAVVQGIQNLGEAIVDKYNSKKQEHSRSRHRDRSRDRHRSERSSDREREKNHHEHHRSSRHRDPSASRHKHGHRRGHNHRSASNSEELWIGQVPGSTRYDSRMSSINPSAAVPATTRPVYSRRRSKSVDDRYLVSSSRAREADRAAGYPADYAAHYMSGGYRAAPYGGAGGSLATYPQSALQQRNTVGNGHGYGYGTAARQSMPPVQQPFIRQQLPVSPQPNVGLGGMYQVPSRPIAFGGPTGTTTMRTPPPPSASLFAASSGLPYAPYDPHQPLPPPRPPNNTFGQPPPHPVAGQPHSFFSKLFGIGGAGNGGGGIRGSRNRKDFLAGEVEDANEGPGAGYGHRYGHTRGRRDSY